VQHVKELGKRRLEAKILAGEKADKKKKGKIQLTKGLFTKRRIPRPAGGNTESEKEIEHEDRVIGRKERRKGQAP